jgi:NAD(P)-dependent dehydrogenase (short-subunit alcohol dehydrogenase family)
VAAARQTNSEISWLVLASGVPLRGALTELSETQIYDTLMVNLVAPAILIRSLLDLPWKKNSSIVVIGSISASRALPNRSVYGASKAGLEHLCRSLGAEVASREIQVNVVAPGVIDTIFLGEGRASLDGWIREHVPACRLGTAEEVATVVRYLALDAPTFLTGARVVVDGGAEARA